MLPVRNTEGVEVPYGLWGCCLGQAVAHARLKERHLHAKRHPKTGTSAIRTSWPVEMVQATTKHWQFTCLSNHIMSELHQKKHKGGHRFGTGTNNIRPGRVVAQKRHSVERGQGGGGDADLGRPSRRNVSAFAAIWTWYLATHVHGTNTPRDSPPAKLPDMAVK